MSILSFYSNRFLCAGIILHLFVLCALPECLAQPAIDSFLPVSGPVSTSVTITGSNFSATPADNIVFIGGIKSEVTAATPTALTVTVPAGAANQPISVTVNGLTTYSRNSFIVTFSGAGPAFTSYSFEYAGQVDSENPDVETTQHAIGDLDGDKRMDVVTVDKIHHTLSVYRNTTAGGTISFAAKMDLSTGQNPRAVAVTDINGDGKPDVIITNSTDNTVSVFRNTTSGGVMSFASKVDFPTAAQPAGLSVTDVDKDGKPDLVINTINLEGYVSVLRNTGSLLTISFAPRVDIQSIGGSIQEIRTADLDGDSKPDILLPDFASNTVKIFRNTSSVGNISFVAAGTVPASINPDNIETGDFNSDGNPDLAVSHFSNNSVWFYNNVSTTGNISLQFSNSYVASDAVYGMAVGDLDGDAKPDVAVNVNLSSFLLFKNATSAGGDLTFDAPVSISAAFTSHGICGDFDNDGKTDIACHAGASRVSIWKNTTARPTVFSFSPSSGKTGDAIIITGSNFTDATTVSFGGVPATSFTVKSATEITATVGAGATGDVAVVSPAGTGKLSGFLFLGPPTISDFSPASATTYETITISGQNFTGTTSVKLGGVPADFTVIDPSTIEAKVGIVASGEVSVTNAYGTATKPGFTYIPKPFIYSFTPADAVTGTTVTITGINLSGTTSVSFGDTPAASFTNVNSTTVSAVVGNGSSGSVRVTNAHGTAEQEGFNYYPPPVITSFTPVEAAYGERVTITGLNFSPLEGEPSNITGVQFGGTAAFSFTVADATTIVATVGEGTTGAITVKSAAGSAALPGFTFIAQPVITNVSPTIAGPGTEITITGQNLARTTAVTFGDIPASSFTIVSDNTLKVIVGAAANGFLKITSPKHTVQGPRIEYTTAPFIYGISPTSGPAGTTLSITGINFQPGAGNNTVYFGGVKAEVLSATGSQVMVTVPVGAGSSPITVTSQITRLAATAGEHFTVVFPVDAHAFNENSFAGKMDFATGTNPLRVKQADVDNDGKADIVVTHNASTFISIYKNQSVPGRLSFAPRIDIEIGIYARALAIADVDGDSKLDLMISSDAPDSKIYIFQNQTTSEDIAFVNAFEVNGFFYQAGDLATGDFDLDGRPDLVFGCDVCGEPATIYAARNTTSHGTISFAGPVQFIAPESTSHNSATMAGLVVTDVNRDGKPDVVAGMDMSSALYFFTNTTGQPGGAIFFTGAKSDPYNWPGYPSITPFTATLDADSYPDIVSGLFVVQNTGGSLSHVLRTNVAATSVYDLNGDGKADILGKDFSDRLSLVKNTSTANAIVFAPPYAMSVPGSWAAEVGDLDGDSKPEICLANTYTATLTILRNRMAEATPSEPSVTSFSPQTAAYASQVVIKGSNLSQATTVTFGGVPALYFTITSDDTILATIGNGATGMVSVTTPGGAAALDGFTFIRSPFITDFSPKEAIPGTTITINGVNFTNATAVNFGGVPAGSFTVESPERIVALVANGASGSVSVTTPIGTANRDALIFYGNPVVNDFTPKSAAAGGQVTLYGSGFDGIAAVTFGDVPASSFIVNDAHTEITATVATGATGSVTVTNRAGTASLPGFTFIYPAITSFTPTTASTGAMVTIKGQFFSDATAVSFGGVAASAFTVVDAETITAVVGAGASGELSVTTPAGTATRDGFTYNEITAVHPTHVSENDFVVRPNPTRDILVVTHPASRTAARLMVVDVLGREIKVITTAQNVTQTETNLGGLMPGIYTIIWSEGKRKLSRVFVVQ